MTFLETLALVFAGAIAYVGLSRRLPGNSAAPAPADLLTGEDPALLTNVPAGLLTDSGGSTPDALQAWANAIFKHEGGTPGDRNVRNNNPGNLKFAGQAGATGADAQGFAIFGSISDGWAALNRQLLKYVRDFPGYSILQIMAHYLGQTGAISPRVTSEGNPFTYAAAVASAVGVSPDATLKDTFGG